MRKPIDLATAQQNSAWWSSRWSSIRTQLLDKNLSRELQKKITNYELRNNVLYNKTIRNGLVYYRVCVPPPLIKDILIACHDSTTADHLGSNVLWLR